MVKFGLGFTAYILLSFSFFLAASNTIIGGIVYFFLLLPFFGVILLLTWIFIVKNRTRTVKIKYKIWGIVLGLQLAVLLTSPGNCYGVKQSGRCYSNLQILIENIPPTGYSNLPHWTLVEDAFLGLLLGYAIALLWGILSTKNS
ncbi:hypothetical protein ACN23B_27505 (plasmid) [Anabaena sp. FACHB-709]|uniref:Uncharacterized protein n=1 Tax=Trichormus variabilis NIES-23 TaxID=1973479 RepID=A0A1Z4KUK8_ANAVA|nr:MULTISPECIES: hypothetical protein [Nostocaceae]BAY72706.1 hypothetical protein NIES23_55340 [Trichormus variabilis NIES-23]MBD2267190.1 hypothetical protein [Anabaena sp. FACHB-709]MBD2276750.1 hypothetical protein [Nostoc sp. PCC 7120 = FACHB-418]MBD2352914.1 hypothetical protein [Trichormus variabilis FACHB-171]RUR72021.1 hypothetical protein DSM107007_58660 [Nostoc sp. PCC 7120 = FACHB-418]